MLASVYYIKLLPPPSPQWSTHHSSPYDDLQLLHAVYKDFVPTKIPYDAGLKLLAVPPL